MVGSSILFTCISYTTQTGEFVELVTMTGSLWKKRLYKSLSDSDNIIINVWRHENVFRKRPHPFYCTKAVLDGSQMSNDIWVPRCQMTSGCLATIFMDIQFKI